MAEAIHRRTCAPLKGMCRLRNDVDGSRVRVIGSGSDDVRNQGFSK